MTLAPPPPLPEGEGEPPQGKDGRRTASINERMQTPSSLPLAPAPIPGRGGAAPLPGSPSPA